MTEEDHIVQAADIPPEEPNLNLVTENPQHPPNSDDIQKRLDAICNSLSLRGHIANYSTIGFIAGVVGYLGSENFDNLFNGKNLNPLMLMAAISTLVATVCNKMNSEIALKLTDRSVPIPDDLSKIKVKFLRAATVAMVMMAAGGILHHRASKAIQYLHPVAIPENITPIPSAAITPALPVPKTPSRNPLRTENPPNF
jgi:hypothetical protein